MNGRIAASGVHTRYTLFIDESGNFKKDKEAVVAGVLLPWSYRDANTELDHHLSSLTTQEGIPNRSEFHFTALKGLLGLPRALSIGQRLLSRIARLDPRICCAAVVGDVRHMSGSEQAYRLMLLDLVILTDTMFPSNISLDQFDLVVSRRTIDGKIATEESDLRCNTLPYLSFALEAGLASRGLVRSLSHHNMGVHIISNQDCWGTIAADFIANLIFNRNHQESHETLRSLQDSMQFRIFEAFGSSEERRARISERDGDWVGALYQWAILPHLTSDYTDERRKAMPRLCQKIIEKTGRTGPRHSVDMLIERIHRTEILSSSARYQSLADIEAGLAGNESPSMLSLLFRLRNYLLLQANKIGERKEIQRLVSQQLDVFETIALDPEEFRSILDFQAYHVEALLHFLDLDAAYIRAIDLMNMTESYKEVWGCLRHFSGKEEAAAQTFDSSYLSMRSHAMLSRCEILAATPGDHIAVEDWLRRIDSLELQSMSNQERSRLSNIRLIALLKGGLFDKALLLGHSRCR